MKDVGELFYLCFFDGNDEWVEITDFAVNKKETPQKYLKLLCGIPSHDMIQSIFFILYSDELQNMLVTILLQLVGVAGKIRMTIFTGMMGLAIIVGTCSQQTEKKPIIPEKGQ